MQNNDTQKTPILGTEYLGTGCEYLKIKILNVKSSNSLYAFSLYVKRNNVSL